MHNLFNRDIAEPYQTYLEGKGIDFMFSAPYAVSMRYKVVSVSFSPS